MKELLSALWGSAEIEGNVTFWATPSKESIHVALCDVQALDDDDVREFNELTQGQNVYFGLGLRRLYLPPHKQGGKHDIVALPGIVLDIDFSDPVAHVAENLPADLDDAYPIIAECPDPSAIVHTGNGVHIYWFFEEPIELDSPSLRTYVQRAFKGFHEPLLKRAKGLGFHLDSTSSIQRVWRVPGTINQKTGKPVELLYCDASARYSIDDLSLKIPRATTRKKDTTSELVKTIKNRLKQVSPKNRYYDAIQAAIKGKSLAPKGQRDAALQGVCSTIAWMPEGRWNTPEDLAEVLHQSLRVWADEKGSTKSFDDEVAKAIDKIRRAQEDYHAQREAKKPQIEGIAKALGVPLDDTEDEQAPDREFFLQHSLIQYRDMYYVYDYRIEQYTHPKTSKEILPLLRDAWKDGPDELTIEYVNDKGQTKLKTLAAITQEYCTNTDTVIGDMTLRESVYVPQDRTFYEAMSQPRVTEAVFDDQIDEWLRLLVGDTKTHAGRPLVDVVLDWIAAIPKLDYQNSALYLDGHSGSGKGLLSNGLARIWRKGPPTDFEAVIGQFNSDIVQCPLLRIDEGLEGRNKDITAKLRALLGRQSFTVNEKFLAPRTVNGAVRLIICANNENVLMLGDAEYSTRDLEAIVGRILHVHACKEASDWLKKNNRNGELTRKWVENDGIAKHCLWLAENRTIEKGKRFLVEGDETEMHRQMVMQGDTNGLVYEWIVRFASSPETVFKRYKATQKTPLANIGNGKILVNTECVIDCWDCFMPKEEKPKSTRIGKVLSKLSYRIARLGPRGNRHRFHIIQPDMILEWCKRNQIGNEDKIMMNLERKLESDI